MTDPTLPKIEAIKAGVDVQDAGNELSIADMLEIVAGGGNGVEYVNVDKLLRKAAAYIRDQGRKIAVRDASTHPLMCMPQSAFESALAKVRSAALAEAVKWHEDALKVLDTKLAELQRAANQPSLDHQDKLSNLQRTISTHKEAYYAIRALATTPPGMVCVPAEGVAFNLGQRVEKISGASWRGRIVGWYSTALTPVGYAVESENEPSSVQIYPAKALRAVINTGKE